MLTGERGIGKSTIIHDFFIDYRGKISGFKTLKEHRETHRSYLFGIHEDMCQSDKSCICIADEHNRLKGIPYTFESKGVAILKECLQSPPDLLIMDELGVFENEAFEFQRLVFECLNSSIPVIGVVKAKSSPFLDAIRNRDDVETITVTKENRNEIRKNLKTLYNRVRNFKNS
jgi:nucleoside-triphosphatase